MPNKILKIKVCGMKEPDNIQTLSELPIDYMGHIFYSKSARYIGEQVLPKISSSIKKTGVFVNADLEEIQEAIQRHQLQVVQLHGSEPVELITSLKSANIEVIKAFGIDDNFDWHQIEPYLDQVDYILFDSKSSQYGGTGKTFNWEKLTSYPYDKPYFLSGGLSLENLEEALNFEDPRLIGLDLNSKFEIKPGLKDIEKLIAALKIICHE